jgi:hypothetical protein
MGGKKMVKERTDQRRSRHLNGVVLVSIALLVLAAFLLTAGSARAEDPGTITINSEGVIDTDDDGLYNYLTIDVDISMATPGMYNVYAGLWGPNGYITNDGVQVELNEVPQNFDFGFLGGAIVNDGTDGTFNIFVEVCDTNWVYIFEAQRTSNFYYHTDFDPAASILPTLTDQIIDTGSTDGYYALAIDVEVDVQTVDSYQLYGNLAGPGGNIYATVVSVEPVEGVQVVQLQFPGSAIIDSAQDGPYDVWIALWLPHSAIMDRGVDYTDHTTAAYTRSEFEPPMQDIIQTVTEHPIDTNENGFYDQLAFYIEVDVTEAGNYEIEGCLNVGGVKLYTYLYPYLDAGVSTQQILFFGQAISGIIGDGPYEITISILSEYGHLLDREVGTTAAYGSSEFEHVYLTVISDERIDIDGLPDYESLEITLIADVSTPGYFDVMADLWSIDYMTHICGAYDDEVYLEDGQEITLTFSGLNIWQSQIDGPYAVDVYLITPDYVRIYAGSATTQAYPYREFAHPGIMGADIDGRDSNDNGKYEYLTIDVDLMVAQYGYYSVDCVLRDSEGTVIGQATEYGEYSEGQVNLEMLLSTFPIILNGVDGPYYLEVTMYESNYWYNEVVDQVTVTTSALSVADLETAVDVLEPCEDQATDSDENGFTNAITVTVPVQVNIEGNYEVFAGILDDYGSQIAATMVDVFLEVGNTEIELPIQILALSALGLSGPYNVQVMVADLSTYMVVDGCTHVTAAYDVSTFEHILIQSISDRTVDLDGDDLADKLVFDVTIDSTMIAEGWFEGYLYSPDGWYLTSISLGVSIASGIETISLEFPGQLFSFYGGEGSYYFHLSISTEILLEGDHLTEYYAPWQFESVTVNEPYSYSTVDGDRDGLSEWLTVDLVVEVTSTGWYDVYGELYTSDWWNFLAGASKKVYLLDGPNHVRLKIAGGGIASYGVDGPSILALTVYLDNMMVEGQIYWTPTLVAGSFEEPAKFVSDPLIETIDADKDGLYDYLVVKVQVEVSSPGKYMFRGTMYTFDRWSLVTVDTINLKPGLQTVTIRFSGPEIWAAGHDGAYLLNLDMLDINGYPIDWTSQFVEGYPSSQFEPFSWGITSGGKKCEINLASDGWLGLVIYGRFGVDVSLIDVTSLSLSIGTGSISPSSWAYRDIDGDGSLDLLLRFSMVDVRTVLEPSSTAITLSFIYSGIWVNLEGGVTMKA